MQRAGKLITFEGGEGGGKSTQIEQAARQLRALGRTVQVLREPGGTAIGEQIRHLLQHCRAAAAMVPATELLLFCAARAQLVRERLEPALALGEIILCDRFLDSTTVYQGVGRQLAPEQVAAINRFAVGECLPDLTIVIDLDPRIGLERARGRELFDRIENESLEFHQRVRAGYRELAAREPDRVKLVDGSQSLAAVQDQIWSLIRHVVC